MSFRFNFSCNDDNKIERNTNLIETNTKKVQWLESEEITVDTQIEQLDSMVQHAKMFICGDNIEIGHVVANEAVANIISEDGVQNGTELAESNHSDLITGKYEGGLKIWEGTTDLIEYLIESVNKNQWKEANVLDLGCGAGILGIYSLLNGAYTTFQDYNKEVIKYVTIPNVLLNLEDDSEMCITRCKFYCGDWSLFNKKLDNSKPYDIILTSETIYNEENYDKLIEIFLQRLSKNGSAYVAAKTCYFGVGGGTRQFEKRIEKCGSLKSEVCWKSTGGIQREILKITHTSQQ